MANQLRPQAPNDAHRSTVAAQAAARTPAQPAFPAQAMPWQPASTRSPRTHLVPPELLG